MASPDITVSIASHGHGAMIEALLGDLMKQTVAPKMEIFLTLNIPEEVNLPKGGGAPPITVIRNTAPKGYGANMNVASKRACGKFFCVLNPDIRMSDTACLEKLGEALAARDHDLISPVIYDPSGKVDDFTRSNLTPLSVLTRRLINPDAGRKTFDEAGRPDGFFWLSGCFMFFDLASYRRIRGFNESLFMYCDDYDICARMYLAGMPYGALTTTSATHGGQRRSRHYNRHTVMHITSIFKVWTSRTFWRVVARNIFSAR